MNNLFFICLKYAGMKMGRCRCIGYPHCQSFDGKKLPFYGACQYTAVQDGCEDGIYQGESTFRVVLDFAESNNRAFTWVKNVHIDIVGHGVSCLFVIFV